ncbi:MAG: glycosyltransferase family 4 protein [Segetibacter sp.]|nr:glycosyltransferase family 4 protein [Segetibacter sp.]
MYKLYLIKRFIEDIIIFPFVLLGRIIAFIKPLDKEYRVYFFFPFYHTGGAEKVHAMVAQATGNSSCIIFFTRKSNDRNFHDEFVKTGCTIKEISGYTDNKWIYFANLIYRGIVTGHINRQKEKPLVFNGQSNFGYKISPWVRKDIPQIELIHSLCSFSYIRIPFLPFITQTVMISTVRIKEHIELYKRYNIPFRYAERINFIMNGIELPLTKPERHFDKDKISVLYVGRSTPEKRVHLIAEMAKVLATQSLPVEITFLGDVENAIPTELWQHCHFLGSHGDPEYIHQVYLSSDILILVSDTEGFPMVVMEAMARGLAIISTAVGEVPLHVKHEENGFLITDFLNTDLVVQQSASYILKLYQDRKLLQEISKKNVSHAYENFGVERFNKQYQQLFQQTLHGKNG